MTVRAEENPQRIPRDEAMGYLFRNDLSPILRVKPGESFVVETEDALSGNIRTASGSQMLSQAKKRRLSASVVGSGGNRISGPCWQINWRVFDSTPHR